MQSIWTVMILREIIKVKDILLPKQNIPSFGFSKAMTIGKKLNKKEILKILCFSRFTWAPKALGVNGSISV